MRKIRIRLRLKIYPILWSIIILLSIYLLIRFAILSFSEEMGQAAFGDALISKLCIMTIEAGPALISFTKDEEGEIDSFPISMIEKEIAVNDFLQDDVLVVKSDHYSELLAENKNYNKKIINAVVKGVKRTQDIGIYQIDMGKEYLLTNGAVLLSDTAGILLGNTSLLTEELSVGYLEGDINQSKAEGEDKSEDVVETAAENRSGYTMEKLKDINYLIRNFYVVDGSTTIKEDLFNAEELLGKDMTMKQDNDAPQILIYHTHSQEAFIDSREGKVSDTVVGVGSYLAEILEDDYGYNVIHDKTEYDNVDGKLDRNVAYNQAEEGVTKLLEENPTIEVIIDLHRNSGGCQNGPD